MVAGEASTLAAGLSLGQRVTPPPLQHRATAPLATVAWAAHFLSLSLREASPGGGDSTKDHLAFSLKSGQPAYEPRSLGWPPLW